jgi:excisionase family DNA binding protein
MPSPLLYKPEGAAAELGVGRTTVFELMAAGELESVKIGRARRIPADALRAYVERLRAAQSRPTPTRPGLPAA